MKQSKFKKLAIGEPWTDEHNQCFQELKRIIANTVNMAHPNPKHEVCLFTDATDKHWGLVVIQVPSEDIGQPLAIQRHQPLAFLSGSFSGAQLYWSVIEKEAFPIMEAIDHLHHFLVAEKPFRIFTNHDNSIYVFDPVSRQLTNWLDGLAFCMNIS
jgi:hypothetical protein